MVMDNGSIIIVIDGYCVLCDNFVKWIAKKDKYHKIHFTTFESDYIKKNYSEIKLKNSVVVINSKKNFFKKSEAVILCLKTIDYNKTLITVLDILPRTILDIGYNLVAFFRYKIFGKKKICSLPNTIISERMLN
jgi:predicted DCC family thiol-disulfide oxidoreductase YuxK